MSYLTLTTGIPNFSKAVISLWFRVPKESVQRAVAFGSSEPDRVFAGIMPLVVFGKPQQEQSWNYLFGDVLTNPLSEDDEYYAFYDWETTGDPYDVGPSYIGLRCGGFPDNSFEMVFNLQMDSHGSYHSLGWVTTSATGVGEDPRILIFTLKDSSPTVLYGKPEHFFVSAVLAPFPLPAEFLKPDEWHHLLLSFDLTGTMSVGNPFASTSCRMWYAIDDEDHRGPGSMGPYRDTEFDGRGADDLDPNAILTRNIWNNSGPKPTEHEGMPVDPPAGNYSPSQIPTLSQGFGIPGITAYVDDIYRVEMAEFQMWTGVALDTGVEKNRRAFIDYERDKNGNPIKDKDGKFTLLPVPPLGQPAPAENLLGKKPEILLSGSQDWIDGKNTGTTGVDYGVIPPIVKPEGQFKSTAEIKAYTPDPSLSKSSLSGRRKTSPVRLTQRA